MLPILRAAEREHGLRDGQTYTLDGTEVVAIYKFYPAARWTYRLKRGTILHDITDSIRRRMQ